MDDSGEPLEIRGGPAGRRAAGRGGNPPDIGFADSDPRVEVDFYEPKRFPGALHYDIWFFVDAVPPKEYTLRVPSWYAELGWHDPRSLPATAYARGHEDVVARWLSAKGN